MKQYKIGMYGGKFLPFHKGHRYCIEIAAKECEALYVILFHGGEAEEKILKKCSQPWLSVEERKKRIEAICQDACRYARVVPSVIDISGLKLPDGTDDWDAETPLVRNLVGPKLDAVYSSEERYGDYFNKAYPEAVHKLVDVKRIHYPISGTAIREMTAEEEQLKWIIPE